jgi:hypothetical protein
MVITLDNFRSQRRQSVKKGVVIIILGVLLITCISAQEADFTKKYNWVLFLCDFDDAAEMSESLNVNHVYEYIKTKGAVLENADGWVSDPSGDGNLSYLFNEGEMSTYEALAVYVDYLAEYSANEIMSVVKSDSYDLLSWFAYGEDDKIYWNTLMIEP